MNLSMVLWWSSKDGCISLVGIVGSIPAWGENSVVVFCMTFLNFWHAFQTLEFLLPTIQSLNNNFTTMWHPQVFRFRCIPPSKCYLQLKKHWLAFESLFGHNYAWFILYTRKHSLVPHWHNLSWSQCNPTVWSVLCRSHSSLQQEWWCSWIKQENSGLFSWR